MTVTVKVNGTSNSLVHKGSMGISTATVPDVCKTPSPGGPVPIPYPNISQSSSLDKGTTTVKADGGMMIAIKGSEFSLSNGDEAGTLGGVKSSTFMKESTWILYSFDVKMEGQGACRLSDKKFQNHENTVDATGEIQAPAVVVAAKVDLECGEHGTYNKLNQKKAAPKYERDHIPSKAALFKAAKDKYPSALESEVGCMEGKLEGRGMTIAIPKASHRQFSPTCGSKNTPTQIANDAKDLKGAAERDTAAMQSHLDATDPDCAKAYAEASKAIKAHDVEQMIKDAADECIE